MYSPRKIYHSEARLLPMQHFGSGLDVPLPVVDFTVQIGMCSLIRSWSPNAVLTQTSWKFNPYSDADSCPLLKPRFGQMAQDPPIFNQERWKNLCLWYAAGYMSLSAINPSCSLPVCLHFAFEEVWAPKYPLNLLAEGTGKTSLWEISLQ